jgi:hypothetical protein
MNYAVRAWRDSRGEYGISIGTVYPVGYDNHVAGFELTEAEIDQFLAECAAARQRAREAAAPLDEPIPGAYENWDAQ